MPIHPKLDFWAVDRGLTRMLTLLVLSVFVIRPLMRHTQAGDFVVSVLFAGILLSGIHSTGITGYARVVAYVVAGFSVLAQLAAVFWQSAALTLADVVSNGVALVLLDAVILFRVFSPGSINSNRIKGAIAGYLVLGLIFASAYEGVDLLSPGSLLLNSQPMPAERANTIYFSFVSLTTMGYGDIVPFHAVSRSLAMAEGLIGQLYPAILIGRLISTTDWSREKK